MDFQLIVKLQAGWVGDVMSFNGADLTGDAESARTIIHQQSSMHISLKRLASKKLKQHHQKAQQPQKSDASGIGDLWDQ